MSNTIPPLPSPTDPVEEKPQTSVAVPNVTTWPKFLAWISSSTTILGNAGVFTTVAAILAGSLTWKDSIPLFIGEAVLILFPQATAATRAEIINDTLKILSNYKSL
jgi:hypothetical protein